VNLIFYITVTIGNSTYAKQEEDR